MLLACSQVSPYDFWVQGHILTFLCLSANISDWLSQMSTGHELCFMFLVFSETWIYWHAVGYVNFFCLLQSNEVISKWPLPAGCYKKKSQISVFSLQLKTNMVWKSRTLNLIFHRYLQQLNVAYSWLKGNMEIKKGTSISQGSWEPDRQSV